MSSSEEDIQTLNALGLTGVQARVYLALIKTGITTIQEVSKASKVARPDTYRVISNLQQLGFVEKIVTIPSKIKPLPLSDTIAILMERRKKENSELHKKATRLLKKHREKNENNAPQEENFQFALIPERENLMFKTQKMTENAQNSIRLMIPLKKLSPWIINHSDMFEKAIRRNVKIQVITEKPGNGETLPKIMCDFNKDPSFEIRTVLQPLKACFGINDTKEILLSTSAKSGPAESPAVWSNNPGLIELAQTYFETAWIKAIEERKEEPIATLAP